MVSDGAAPQASLIFFFFFKSGNSSGIKIAKGGASPAAQVEKVGHGYGPPGR